MKKLNLNALKERAKEVASEELLMSISGGTEDACHDDSRDNEGDLYEMYGNMV